MLAAVNFTDLKNAFPANSLPANPNLSAGLIVSNLLPYIFLIAGLMLLTYLIMGGFGLMTSGGEPKNVQSAQDKITNAIIGFLIIFAAYWITQILQSVFGLSTGVL